MTSVAVIGAGIAGLRTAQILAQKGFRVTVFDKGSLPGGRICTRFDRSTSPTHFPFNYGAQVIFGAGFKRFPSFAATVNGNLKYSQVEYPSGWGESALSEGSTTASINFDWISDSRNSSYDFDGINGFIFRPGMSTLPKLMAEHANRLGVSVQCSTLVDKIKVNQEGKWSVSTRSVKNKDVPPIEQLYDQIIVAVPSPQASALLLSSNYDKREECASQLSAVVYDPCWVLMLSFSSFPYLGFESQSILNNPTPNIAFISNEASRITHSESALNDVSSFTILASSAWSKHHLEDNNASVEELLLSEFKQAGVNIPSGAKLISQRSHRWRFSRVKDTLKTTLPFIYDANFKIGLCGDYFLGPNIEHAFESGEKLAIEMTDSRAQ